MRRVTPEGWQHLMRSFASYGGERGIRAHADIRMEKVVQALTVVFHLRRCNRLNPIASVQVAPAEVQLQRGRRIDQTQAAHNMPCNIKIAGQNVWELIPNSNPDATLLRTTVAGWFASTVVLPSVANNSDSLWEHFGLTQALKSALVRVISATATLPGAAAALSQAFEHFRTEARGPLTRAQDHNQRSLQAESDPAGKDHLTQIQGILDVYGDALTGFSPASTIGAHTSKAMIDQYDQALAKK
jgi:hypothetical protein